MSDELPLEERVQRHLDRNPDASVPAIAGALGESPADVAGIVDGSDPDIEQDSNTDTGDHGRRSRTDLRTRFDQWAGADFADPQSETWPDELLDREQWMGHAEKKPFAPWGDRDPPIECSTDDCPADRMDDPECDCDGRWSWGHRGHYVDGDDVRCPETVDIQPAFVAFLEHLGMTYGDISQSGAGVHAIYRGDLPDICGIILDDLQEMADGVLYFKASDIADSVGLSNQQAGVALSWLAETDDCPLEIEVWSKT